ncbi:MAG: hypothetical protein SFV15_16155 [Polyangiaceae bacterium]|nr:hypothetical protein [Polyangiaceae bacterium]
MPHPLATQLATLMDWDLVELRTIVARFVQAESDPAERQRMRLFGARLGAFKRELDQKSRKLTAEELELALTVLLVTSVEGPEEPGGSPP